MMAVDVMTGGWQAHIHSTPPPLLSHSKHVTHVSTGPDAMICGGLPPQTLVLAS